MGLQLIHTEKVLKILVKVQRWYLLASYNGDMLKYEKSNNWVGKFF